MAQNLPKKVFFIQMKKAEFVNETDAILWLKLRP